MQTITLDVQDKVFDKLMSVLNGFFKEEVKVRERSMTKQTIEKIDLSAFQIDSFKQIDDPVAWQRQMRDEC